MSSAGCSQSYLRSDVFVFEVSHQRIDAAEFKIAPVDHPDSLGLIVDDGDLVVLHVITQGERPANPKALSFGGCNLVADALGGDLPFELGKGQEHIEGQSPH